MNYFCLFPLLSNIHLKKDVGMIPYIMHLNHNMNSTIICNENDEYTYLEEVKGLKLDFLKKYTKSNLLNGIVYLYINRKKIDYLQLFHPSIETCIYALFMKLFNKNTKIYLKMDISMDNLHQPREFIRTDLMSKIKIFILRTKIDLISAETKSVVQYLNNNNINCIYIPNGYYDKDEKYYDYKKKKQIITVGRIGAAQKRNDVFLDAIIDIIDDTNDWIFKFIGPIDESFKVIIKNKQIECPKLEKCVKFIGPIDNKSLLEKEYAESSVFCLTSDWEGFPLVFLEAQSHGNYIVSSDFDSAIDVICSEQLGKIFKRGNVKELSNILYQICNNEINLEISSEKIKQNAKSKYYWPCLCQQIINALNS